MSIPRLLTFTFKCMFSLLLIGNTAYALTITVTTNADTGAGSFRDAVATISSAGAGPHTINFAAGVTSISLDSYSAPTLSNSNVTITGRYVGCDPDITITSINSYFPFTINGSNVKIEGIKWGIRVYFQGGTGNSIYGCWFNMNAAGNAAAGNVNNNLLNIDGSTNMTVGGTSSCNQRNVFSAGAASPNQLPNAILVVGNCAGLVITGNYIGTDKNGTTKIANNTSNGIASDATAVLTNAQITNNTIIGNAANGIYLLGSANGIQITGNNLGATAAGAAGATDLGNKKAGLRFEASTNSATISNNIVIDNGQNEDLADNSGIYIFGQDVNMSNITVSGNRAGVDASNNKRGNDFAGIYVQRFGTGTMTSVVVSNNIVGDNGNGYPNKKSHGIAFRDLGPASLTNLMVTGNYVGTTTSFTDIGNYGNGIEFYGVNGFTASGNTIGFNKFATTVAGGWNGGGIMVNGNSTNGSITGNFIGVSSTNVAIGNINPTNAVYPNQMAGITLEQATGITISSNTIKNNNFGIQVTNVGSSYSTGNTITANTISSNTVYGIYIPGGNSNNIGNGTSGGANIISQNASHGIYIINTTSTNNKISRNQIFCNTGQGIKLNYGASQGNNGQAPPVITTIAGNTVSGTATAGATIEIFVDDPTCQLPCGSAVTDNRREGKTYLATVTATGGAWSYTDASAIDANNISATATVGSNTSEFSICNLTVSCPAASNAGPNQNLCNVTTTTLAGNTPTNSGTGLWTVVSGSGTVTTPTSPTSGVTGLVAGTTLVLKWTISKVGCADSESTVTIIDSAPVTANAGATQNVCNSTTATLAGSNPSPGTGTWTVTSGTGVVTTPSSATSGVTGLTVGATSTFLWTVTNGACSANASVNIVSNAAVTANAGATQNVCNSTTATLAGSNPSPGTGAWTVTSGIGVVTTPSSATSGVTGLTVGASSTFKWTVTNGACTANSSVTINSNATVTANAGATQNVCNSTTATLAGSNPSPGTGAWTVTSGTGVVTTPSSATSGVTGLTVGATSTFLWTVTNGACTASASVNIISNASVTANAGATQNVCNSTTATLAGSNPSPGTGAWTVTSGTGVVTTPSSATSGVTGLTVGGTSTFLWTVTNGACTASASVNIISNATVTANAGATQNICNSTTATLAGSNPSPGTGLWTVVSGSGAVTTPSSANSGVTGLTVGGTSVFKWTVTNGACTANANVTINSSAGVTATASATSSVCSTSPVVTLTGSNPSPGTGLWTVSGGTATFGNATNASTSATITSGTSLTFTWTITNGACSSFATATTTVTSPVTATANATSSVCAPAPVTLTGSNPSPGTGVWTVTSGGTATFVNANNASTTATITSGTSVTFTWTVTNGTCVTSASAVSTTSSPVTATASATSAVCATTPVVSLSGNDPAPGSGQWTVTGGTVTFGNANSQSTTATITSGTSLTFTWTITNGACTNSANASTTVSAAVTANAGSPQSICNLTTATLAGSNPSPGTGAWTTTSGTGVVTTPSSPSSGVTGLTVGSSSTFLWTVTNGACSATSSVTISVSAPGTTSAGANQALCNQTTTTLAGSGTGTWTTISGTGVVTTPSSATSGVTGLTVGATSVFEWTVSSGACSGSAQVTVTVDAPPVGNAGADQPLCNQTTATLNATGGGTWTTKSGTGIVSSPTNPSSGVTNLTVGGSSTFTWTVTNGACSSTSDVVVSSSSPVTANAGSDQTLCNVTTATLAAVGSGQWTTTFGTGVVTSPTNPSSGVTNLTPGQSSVFEWTVTNGACSASATVTIASSSTVTADAGPAQSICNTTSTNLAATGTGSWSVLSGTGSVTTPTSPTSGVTGLTIGGSSVFTWTVTNGACSNSANVTVTVSPGSSANAGANQLLCNATTTTLNATAGTNGTWLASTDANIANLTDPHSSVTVINSPATLTWQIDGGGCGNVTATVTLTTVVLAKPILDGVGLSQACSGSTYAYSINNIDGAGSYNWSGNPSAGINITPSTGTSVSVSATSSGKLIVFVDKGGCSDSASAVIKVLPGPPSGRDTLKLATCVYTNYKIKSPLFDGFSGTWTSKSGTITFTFNSADSTTTIDGLVEGVNDTLTYSISNACGSVDYIFTIKAGGFFSSLEASGPSDTLCVTQARNLNALVTPPGNYTYYWVSHVNYNNPVIDGSTHLDSTTVPTYSVTPRGPNNIYFVYVVDKASKCQTAIDTAYIHAVEGQDLNVPNLITPNEDNMNDHWVLKDKTTGQDILPGSHFELYNRWGQRVFIMDNYDNRFKADHISDGVYYFNVKSGCGDKEYKGWLQILGNTNP